jgi:hypothetical protein
MEDRRSIMNLRQRNTALMIGLGALNIAAASRVTLARSPAPTLSAISKAGSGRPLTSVARSHTPIRQW